MTALEYEVIYIKDNFKCYNYFATLKEAMSFAKTVNALKIRKGRKVVKEFRNGSAKV